MSNHRTVRSAVFMLCICLLVPPTWALVSTGFVENRGQVDQAVKYYGPGSRVSVYFTENAVVFDLKEEIAGLSDGLNQSLCRADRRRQEGESGMEGIRGCAVYIRFEGANPSPIIEARGELATKYNYFLGNIPSEWQTEVSAFSEIIYHDVWPGIDLVYREERGAVSYEIVTAPGVDSGQARFRYEGVDRTNSIGEGVYRIETEVGSLEDIRPVAGRAVGTFCWYEHGPTTVEESSPEDDPSALLWGTYLGGLSADYAGGIALDASDNPVVTGYTLSNNFPVPGGYDQSYNEYIDAFVAKLSSSGDSLLWGTYLGGGEDDRVAGIALDASNNAVVTGRTRSTDFPVPGGYDQSYNGSTDAFVAKLSSSGDSLLWGTYLGGGSGDDAEGIALDAWYEPVVTGYTLSADFPVPSGYDQSYNGDYDVFAAKLSSSGDSLLWGTYLGGDSLDIVRAIALDASNNAVVTGYTLSADFPVPGGYDQSYNGEDDVFVAKLSISGDALLWGTYVGGGDDDRGTGIALDVSDNPVVAGYTYSSDFPVPGGYDQSLNGVNDVFVAKLSSSGDSLLWGTYLGGGSNDVGTGIALDTSYDPVVTGYTRSTDFPTPEGYDQSLNGINDAFVAKLSSSGDLLLWGTYLGGGVSDIGSEITLDASYDPVVVGYTTSTDFPVPGGYDRYSNGDTDAFVAKIAIPDISSVDERDLSTGALVLGPCAPNPFGGVVRIRFHLPHDGPVKMGVYDIRGRLVRILKDGPALKGVGEIGWDGADRHGTQAAPGIYFCRIEAGGVTQARKMILVR